MPAAIPIQRKTPFLIAPHPLLECSSAHAGALSVSRVLRSLGLPGLIEANVPVKQRARGCTEAQHIESLVLLNAMGGDCYEDLAVLGEDECLARGLGYHPPQPDATRKFLDQFHDPAWELHRPAREQQKTFFPTPSVPLEGLHMARTGLVHQVARRYAAQGQPQRLATLDAETTIIAADVVID